MRLIRLLVAVACVALGAIIGALNRQAVTVDLGALQPGTTLGVALIVALLAGFLLGALAISAGVVVPLRRRLARAERRHPESAVTPAAFPGAQEH